MKASWHMSLVACLVVSSAITAASQNKVIWKASVMPERIAVYESNSTESSIVNTLERGDFVDVVFEVTVSGTDWCRVARAEASEPLGFVLCLNLGKGSLVAKQNLRAVPAGNHSLALAASPASDQASAGLAVLTNKDILELHKAGLTEQVLVAKIKSSQCNFDTSPSQLSQLKSAGLPDAVILAMVEAPALTVATLSDPAPVTGTRSSRGCIPNSGCLLREGTEVPLKFATDLSSKTAQLGDPVELILDEDLKVGETVLVARGAHAVATVSAEKHAEMIGRPGDLAVQLEYLVVGNNHVRLRGTKGREGESKTGATVALTVLFGPIGLIKHGKEVQIRAGTPLTVFVDQDILLPPIE